MFYVFALFYPDIVDTLNTNIYKWVLEPAAIERPFQTVVHLLWLQYSPKPLVVQ